MVMMMAVPLPTETRTSVYMPLSTLLFHGGDDDGFDATTLVVLCCIFGGDSFPHFFFPTAAGQLILAGKNMF